MFQTHNINYYVFFSSAYQKILSISTWTYGEVMLFAVFVFVSVSTAVWSLLLTPIVLTCPLTFQSKKEKLFDLFMTQPSLKPNQTHLLCRQRKPIQQPAPVHTPSVSLEEGKNHQSTIQVCSLSIWSPPARLTHTACPPALYAQAGAVFVKSSLLVCHYGCVTRFH